MYFISNEEVVSIASPKKVKLTDFVNKNLIITDDYSNWFTPVFSKDLQKWSLQKLGVKKGFDIQYYVNNEEGNLFSIN